VKEQKVNLPNEGKGVVVGVLATHNDEQVFVPNGSWLSSRELKLVAKMCDQATHLLRKLRKV
jgi:hypothetical protein